MKTRILTAIAILAVVIPAILLGGWFMFGLIAIIAVGGALELSNTSSNVENWPIWLRPVLIGLVLIAPYVSKDSAFGLIGIGLLISLSVPIINRKFTYTDSFAAIVYVALFGLLVIAFHSIHSSNPMYIWWIIVLTYICDTGAYFVGSFFGKNKLAPHISPNKTIEGSLGGWVIAIIVGYVFQIFLIPEMSVGISLLICILLPIAGQLGDLAFSSIKRNLDIKDFSNFLPGHGGVLDRIDSLLFTLILFYALGALTGVL